MPQSAVNVTTSTVNDTTSTVNVATVNDTTVNVTNVICMDFRMLVVNLTISIMKMECHYAIMSFSRFAGIFCGGHKLSYPIITWGN